MVSGIDRAMFGYFGSKLAAEQVIADSGMPWTTLRATQFHDLMLMTVQQMAKLPLIPVPSGVRFQPIDAMRSPSASSSSRSARLPAWYPRSAGRASTRWPSSSAATSPGRRQAPTDRPDAGPRQGGPGDPRWREPDPDRPSAVDLGRVPRRSVYGATRHTSSAVACPPARSRSDLALRCARTAAAPRAHPTARSRRTRRRRPAPFVADRRRRAGARAASR